MSDFPIHVTPDGQHRVLNLLPSDRMMMAALPQAGALPPLSQITPRFFRPPWLAIKDQDGYGACVGHGSTRGVEFVRALRGQDLGIEGQWIELSAWDLYARLCGGIDRGANILNALTMLSKDGVALMEDVPYGTINPNIIPASAAADRPRFRIEIGEVLNSFEAMAWAVAVGDGVVYSVHVGDHGVFNYLDGDGVPTVTPGTANHCVFAGGEITISKKWGLLLGSDNSWGTGWGKAGRFRCSAALIQCQKGFEAYRVRGVFTDPLAVDNVPPVAVSIA